MKQLHACYDYCAAWKEAAPDEDPEEQEEQRADVTAIQLGGRSGSSELPIRVLSG